MEFYGDQAIRVGDLVEVSRDARSGIDGSWCKVTKMDNLTALATCVHVGRGGRRNIHVSKLRIVGRHEIEQLKLELKL